MAGDLTFFGWRRPGIYTLPEDANEKERLLAFNMKNRERDSERLDATLTLSLLGPEDVVGLQPGAVVRTSPPASANGVEVTKCVFAEFAAPDLPWRYSQETVPAPSADSTLPPPDQPLPRPWMVLVVGTPEELIAQADGTVTLNQSLCLHYDLAKSARWAHVQEENGITISRLLSSRRLEPNQNYNAAIVRVGKLPSWPLSGTTTLPLPLLHFWQFQTGEEEDFGALATRLKAGTAGDEIGKRQVSYKHLDGSPQFTVWGALVKAQPLPSDLDPNPAEISADLEGLFGPPEDEKGRPIIGVPLYGDAWIKTPVEKTWGAEVNLKPQHRAAAGLGMWAGIELQEMISSAATDQAGALDIAAQRIRNFAFGLQANTSLWQRRLPTDLYQRLFLFGPSLRRIVTNNGPVLNRIAGGNRPLPPNIFSSAAQRIFRFKPIKNLAEMTATLPSNILTSANTCPPPDDPSPDGLPHFDPFAGPGGFGDPDQTTRECISFRGRPMGFGPNPRMEQGVTFIVKDGKGNPLIESRIGTWENDPDLLTPDKMALAFGRELEIILPTIAKSVELTIMHLISPATIFAFNSDQSLAGRLGMVTPMQEPQVFTITGRAINRVVVTALISLDQSTYLHDFCYTGFTGPLITFEDLIQKAIDNNRIDHQPLLDFLNEVIANPPIDPTTNLPKDPTLLRGIVHGFFPRVPNLRVPTRSILNLVESFLDDGAETFKANVDKFLASPALQEPDDESILELAKALQADQPHRLCDEVRLETLSTELTEAIDPTLSTSHVRHCAVGGISGLGPLPLLPPEICVGLDMPTWQFLRDRAPDWLLPGLETIEPDSVIGLESNPVFIDAFMLGINTQTLSELRWRNIQIASKCTPIRMFWGQFNPVSNQREPDIQGVEQWDPDTSLGSGNHREPITTGGTFVLVIRGELFRRYPATLVYLVSAGEPADWKTIPDLKKSLPKVPTFQGSIGDDITFFRFDITSDAAKKHWVVLEETPQGYSFFNDRIFDFLPDPNIVKTPGFDCDTFTDVKVRPYCKAKGGRRFAMAAFVNPLRVFIRGEDII
jgi:hypothetical protein